MFQSKKKQKTKNHQLEYHNFHLLSNLKLLSPNHNRWWFLWTGQRAYNRKRRKISLFLLYLFLMHRPRLYHPSPMHCIAPGCSDISEGRRAMEKEYQSIWYAWCYSQSSLGFLKPFVIADTQKLTLLSYWSSCGFSSKTLYGRDILPALPGTDIAFSS